MSRADGPFQYFNERSGGVTSEDLRGYAQTLKTSSTDFVSLADTLQGRVTAAQIQVSGPLEALLNPQQVPAIGSTREIAGASLFPSVLIGRWADDVDTFDAGVSGLNQRYTTAAGPDADQEARTEAKRSLDPEYEGLIDTLETGGNTIASTLESGPDASTLEQMLGDREIPVAALGLFPGVTVDDDVRQLAQARELMDELVADGLLDEPVDEDSLYFRWLLNAQRQDVDDSTIRDIIEEHDIDPEDFDVLDGLEEVQDRDGKSFFILPTDISGEDARLAVLMTYVFNAGTDYDEADDNSSTDNDFDETPYSADEIQRIMDRQGDNNWFSYNQDVGFVHGNGGRMATTPNGILMGLGGNIIQDVYSQKGGTTYGDIFMLNIDDPDDAEDVLREVIESGVQPTSEGAGSPTNLDMDRLLHHEERHSQQWAEEGYAKFLASYAWEQLTGGNGTEEGAGLADGGYE